MRGSIGDLSPASRVTGEISIDLYSSGFEGALFFMLAHVVFGSWRS
jgi:hypothetical protein